MKFDLDINKDDLRELHILCGKHGLSISELFENVVYDLVGQGNGSDERDLINQWFYRCWFGFPDETLLKELLENYDLEEFMAAWDEKQYCKNHPEEFTPEEIKDNWWDDVIKEYTEEWTRRHPDEDLNKQVEIVRKWVDEHHKYEGESV